MKWLTLVVGLGALVTACAEPSPSPSAVATDFVARVRLAETEAARRDALDLLSADARAALDERAARAAAAAGAPEGSVSSWDVLRYLGLARGDRVVSAEAIQVGGDQATVRVRMARYYGGADATRPSEARDVEVRLVREGGAWRVALGLGALPAPEAP